MKILLATMVCLVFSLSVHAQSKPINSEYYSNLTPKTPEQFKLGTFGNTPINYYTGLPEISLPLMTLEGIETNVPISLNYDASGIRTDDLSGPVGMKWSLNAGGYVVREVNGRPDEFTETGFWRTATLTNYFREMDFTNWSGYSQANSKDTAPDEFAMIVDGRTIRFVFDKNGIARVIPRQNIRITPSFVTIDGARLIIRLDVIMENGRKYVFGGDLGSVEQRKIETLRIGTHFLYTKVFDCPFTQHDNKIYYDCGTKWTTTFSSDVDFKVTSIPNHTSKWYLTSIIEPSGETTTFEYQQLPDVTYTTRPNTILIRPLCFPIIQYERKITDCPGLEVFNWCPGGEQTTYYYIQNTMVVSKFPQTRPGSSPEPTAEYFSPMKYGWSPGAVNEYRTRITESNIRLTQITSSTKNRVSFLTSSRTDLPSAFKYDLITLYNMQNQLVKSIRLNFDVLEANKENDRCWISEALMMRQLSSIKTSSTFLYADYFLNHTASDISSDNYRKFVFEGLKPYNYYRTFLSAVVDVTAATRPLDLFRFEYRDTNLLRRRTTTYADASGLHRSLTSEESYGIPGHVVQTAQSFLPQLNNFSNRVPLVGLLTRIYYPTNGSTQFTFGVRTGVRLTRIEDLNEKGEPLSQREIEYISPYTTWQPVTSSYQDFRVEGTSSWMKYHISSSAPQNDPNFTHGVMEGNGEVIVYHGTKTANNGFERFNFTYPPDYADYFSEMRSYPVEKDTNNIPYKLSNIFPFPKANSRDHLRGLLKRHQVFSAGSSLDKPLRETIHTYELNPYGYDPEHIIGFKGGSFMWTTSSSTHFFYGSETGAERRYRWGWTHYFTDWMVLKKTQNVVYDDEDPSRKITKVTEFDYDSIHQQQTRQVAYNEGSRSEKSIVTYKYVTDKDYVIPTTCHSTFKACRDDCDGTDECYVACDQSLYTCLSASTNPDIQTYSLMRKKFQYTIPLETKTFFEKGGVSTLTEVIVHKFQVHKPTSSPESWSVKPAEVWAIQKRSGTLYQESKLSDVVPVGLVLDPAMRKVHTFNSYDLVSGNVSRQTLLDGTVSEYSWEPLSNFSTMKTQTINPGTGQHQTAYQQIPLVGMTSVTDPNSRVTRYQYDLNKRLKVVLDHGSNVLTSYRYHYASELKNEMLNASFKVSGSMIAGDAITFTTTNDSREYGVTKYVWNFGDGSANKEITSSGTVYLYRSAGIYTVTLVKSNPEYGETSSSQQVTIFPPLNVTLCIDGPSYIDIPPSSLSPVPGGCTTFPMSLSSTILKASVSGGCGTLVYRWEKMNSSGTWDPFNSGSVPTSAPPFDFVSRALGTYRVRCVVTDPCGSVSVSNSVDLVIF
jgi:YD repeat-containing protein